MIQSLETAIFANNILSNITLLKPTATDWGRRMWILTVLDGITYLDIVSLSYIITCHQTAYYFLKLILNLFWIKQHLFFVIWLYIKFKFKYRGIEQRREIMLLSIYCFWLIFVLLNIQVSYNTVVLMHTVHL